MAETFCGKTCGECSQKEVLNCPGCRIGPGREFGGDCQLAACCRGKGHETCETCAFHSTCATLRRKDHFPEDRRRKREAAAAEKAAMARRAPLLGKWLWVLFWLVIPGTIASILTEEQITGLIPGLYIPGILLQTLCTLAASLILWKLSEIEDRYRTAAICSLIPAVVTLFLAVATRGSEPPTWTLLITLPAAVVSLVGEYNQFTAHAIVTSPLNQELSEKWTTLWKWYIGSYAAILGSLFLLLLIPILGLLTTLAGAIALMVTGILKLVYLYRTAKLFREYPQ